MRFLRTQLDRCARAVRGCEPAAIARWDLARVAETLPPLIDPSTEQAIARCQRGCGELTRLGRDQGKRGRVRDLLAPVYGWFTEGFDPDDLIEPKALLDEL